MKRIFGVMVAVILVATATMAAPRPPAKAQPFPGTLANARYVYVAAYDGDQFDPNLLPDDRYAIAAVQDQIQKWGKLTLV